MELEGNFSDIVGKKLKDLKYFMILTRKKNQSTLPKPLPIYFSFQ